MCATDNVSNEEIANLAPADQPNGVHQITEGLFAAYTIDGGAVHLAGCELEDCLFVRLGFRYAGESVELYLDRAGHELDVATIQTLGLGATAELDKPPESAETEILRLAELGGRLAEKRFPPGSQPRRVDLAAVWCKFARGKLRFTIGEDSTDLSFSGWARSLEAPLFVCPYSGVSTFHLAATDDGRMVAAEQIESCAQTGRRVLKDELVCCVATGRRVVAELTEICPVSGRHVLREEMVECPTCGGRVSPSVVRRDRCAACRSVQPVSKADPRMARLLDEHPLLDRWRNWRISETATTYILTATGWIRRLLVVVDKDSLRLERLATGNRFFSAWRVADPPQYEYLLRV